MADFPQALFGGPQHTMIGSWGTSCPPSDYMISQFGSLNFTAGAVWPAANLAVYIPVLVEFPATAFKMVVHVVTQNGNLDVGIYDEQKNRLVSAGSTAVAAAGIQIVDITDTVLVPGLYYIGMCCSSGTASFRACATQVQALRFTGCQQQAVGAVTLPDPAVFANPTSPYTPAVGFTTVVSL